MLRKLLNRLREEDGFTLVELLVVILIIGILSSLALPAFITQREKGHDAVAKSAARTAATAAETCATENSGSYALCDANKLKSIEPALNNASALTVTVTATTYDVQVTSNSANWFKVSRTAAGVITRTCATAVRYGCQTGGTW